MHPTRHLVALAALGLALTACEAPLDPAPDASGEPHSLLLAAPPAFATSGVIGVDVGFVFEAVDLGHLGTGPFHTATSINNRGHVTGFSETAPGVPQAFFWTTQTGLQAIGSGSGIGSETRDMSTNDNVVGTIRNADGSQDAFLWSPGTGLQVLGRFGKAWARGMGVNDAGSVVGYFSDEDPTSPTFGFQSYLRRADGSFEVLPPVPTSAPISPFNTTLDINDRDEVVGLTLADPLSPGSPVVAYYWSPSNGGSTGFGSLGPNYVNHTVWSINDAGEVAGAASGIDVTTGAPIVTPFLWTRSGGYRNLRDEGFPADLFGSAVEANSLGYVAVSVLDLATGIRTPSVWVPQVGLVLLPTLGGESGEVFSINDLGQAVGWSQNTVGDTTATLWDLTFPPSDAVSGQINAIDQIIATQEDPEVAEELNHAAIWLEQAQDELTSADPDLDRVLELIGKAVGEVGKARREGLEASLADRLIRQQVDAAGALARQAVDSAGPRVGKGRLAKANRSLAEGDEQVSRGRYDKALDAYRKAISLVAGDDDHGHDDHGRDGDGRGDRDRHDRGGNDHDEDANGCPTAGRHHAHSYVWGHGWSWWSGQGWPGFQSERRDPRWGWWKKGGHRGR